MDFTGTGNTLNLLHPRTLQLVMDSLRYWVLEMHVDGFRFDLASTLARDANGVNKLHAFFRDHSPGPSSLAGEADRGALGRGRRRLSGRQLSDSLGGMERQIPRRDPQLLERRRREDRRIRLPPHRQSRPLPDERPPPLREHQFHHRARRLHPERSRQLQRQTQRSERRRQSRRRQQQSQLELRRRRADRRSGNQPTAAAAAPQFPHHAFPFPRRADAHGRRRMGAHAAGQQQRLLPGQRNQLAQLGASTTCRSRCWISRDA